jgi:hypothetical protein
LKETEALKHKLFIAIMNATCSKQTSVGGSRRIAVPAAFIALLLISIHLAHGNTGYTLSMGTNVFNFYAYNGTSGLSDGVDPSPPTFSGTPAPSYNYDYTPTAFQGMILQKGGQNVPSSVIPPTGGITTGAAFRFGSPAATLFPYNNADPTGVNSSGTATSLTLLLDNPNSSADEIRLDWYATFTYGGPPNSTPLANVPLLVNVFGYMSTSASFYALAGGETITDGSSTTTATIGNGFTHAGLGAGPWVGQTVSGATSFGSLVTAPFNNAGLTVLNGDTVAVQGYLDLVLDPGIIQVQLSALLPPQIGIANYGNLPAVFYPTASGLNFNLQTAPDLSGTNWVNVTNGIPISGFIITNATSPAFFRLN